MPRPSRLVALALLAAALPAQSLRLSERLAAPLVHVELPAAAGASWLADLERLGLDLSGQGGTAQVVQLLERLLARGSTDLSWEEVEFALTGIMPRAGAADLPLLVFRARLAAAAAASLRDILERGGLAREARSVGGHPVFALSTDDARGPGSVVELALAGADLIASNHAQSLDEVLDPRTRAGADALAADPLFRSLSSKLEVEPGALILWADVARLRHRLAPSEYSVGWLLRWSGLWSTRGLLLGLHRVESGTRLSVLLGSEQQHDGWLGLIEPMPVHELVQRVPLGGAGGIAFALEPSKLLTAEPASGSPRFGLEALRQGLNGGCSKLGLDLERHVVAQLGQACTVRFVELGGQASRTGAVVSLQTRSRDAARRLFEDCARSTRESPAVALLEDEPGSEELVVPTGRHHRLHLGVIDDDFVLAFADGALARARESTADARRERPRERQKISAALAQLGGGKRRPVAGVFRIDLPALAAATPATEAPPLPRRHVGYLEVEPGVVRVEILGER